MELTDATIRRWYVRPDGEPKPRLTAADKMLEMQYCMHLSEAVTTAAAGIAAAAGLAIRAAADAYIPVEAAWNRIPKVDERQPYKATLFGSYSTPGPARELRWQFYKLLSMATGRESYDDKELAPFARPLDPQVQAVIAEYPDVFIEDDPTELWTHADGAVFVYANAYRLMSWQGPFTPVEAAAKLRAYAEDDRREQQRLEYEADEQAEVKEAREAIARGDFDVAMADGSVQRPQLAVVDMTTPEQDEGTAILDHLKAIHDGQSPS